VTIALKKALIERALGGELGYHLGYSPGGDKPAEASNHRSGSTGKTVLIEDGPLRIEVPRDPQGAVRQQYRCGSADRTRSAWLRHRPAVRPTDPGSEAEGRITYPADT
jgi:transposase-like protein